jgi:DNA primase
VAILKRHTSNVVVNFDPDAAGSNAAEKSIALLTEEGFSIKIVTLDGGLDPDRYVRERGVEAYSQAIRGAKWQADYLIDRARQLFPGTSPDQKVKAVKYLLPYVLRIPDKMVREEFGRNAAFRLMIDSHILAAELRQATLKRRDNIEVRTTLLTGVEKILVRALAITDPDFEASRRLCGDAIVSQPSLFEHLVSFTALQAMATREANDPMEVVVDPGQRALVAEALLSETKPPNEGEVRSAIQEIHERSIEARIRDIRARLVEAERIGDAVELATLWRQKRGLDSELQRIQRGDSSL